jgi:hypothetical protein
MTDRDIPPPRRVLLIAALSALAAAQVPGI